MIVSVLSYNYYIQTIYDISLKKLVFLSYLFEALDIFKYKNKNRIALSWSLIFSKNQTELYVLWFVILHDFVL